MLDDDFLAAIEIADETWSLSNLNVDPDTMPIRIIPATRPPATGLLPLLVLIVREDPPLEVTVTGDPVLVVATFIQTSAEAETGMLVVA